VSLQLVFPHQAPPDVEAAVKSILQQQKSGTIPGTPNIFVRIGRLDAFFQDGQIRADELLAVPNGWPPPVVFLTIPEGIAGFTVDKVLLRVGYTPAEIPAVLHGGQAAAIIFRYTDAVQSLAAWDGDFSSDVLKRVVRATWKNLFRTFKDIADSQQTPLHFEADDRQFVASFPSSGQLRLMAASYSHVKAEGGADWRYRDLLQRLLWVTPNFLGTGWAANGNGGPGAPEYLGPNASLSSLAAAAIVSF
jgi:hypothetical protein